MFGKGKLSMKKIIILLVLILSNIMYASQYDVFVDFGDKVDKNVQNISHSLKGVGINSLYSQGYVVHLTLYLTEYKDKDLDKIKAVVDEIAKETKPFKVNFYGMHATKGHWLMIDATKSPELQKLSDKVVNKLLSVRDTSAKVPDWAKNIPAKAASFEKYGSPNVYENFDPHITLTTPADKVGLSQFFRNYPFEEFSDKIVGIGITKADSLGQSKEIIYYKKLK